MKRVLAPKNTERIRQLAEEEITILLYKLLHAPDGFDEHLHQSVSSTKRAIPSLTSRHTASRAVLH